MSDTLRDARAYLQTRVARFTGVACVFFTLFLVADLAVPAEGEPIYSSSRLASLAVLLVNLAVWQITRRGVRSIVLCRALELSTMAVAATVFGLLPIHPPIPGAGGVMSLFAPIPMAVMVLLRAAIIPSPAWLSVSVGLIWGAIATTTAMLGWEGIALTVPGQHGFDSSMLGASLNLVATVALSFVAGVVSHVVYGLQAQVREAMQLGPYTLESKIGEGGMGEVYRARHHMLRRPTAVKLLPPEKSGEGAIARFEREVQETSRLTHPNTVAIFDYGRTDDGVFYYVMEYLDGISLEKLVALDGAQPVARVVHVLTQVADALAEAHDKGLVHRDVKPDNILLCEHGGRPDVVKVVDFGLVKDVATPQDAALSSADTVQGTPLYMAPESLRDPDAVDHRTDLYALGAVAYFLLSGRPVFEGRVVEVLGHHLHTPPTPLRERGVDVPVSLEAVVMQCLHKAPEDRFASAGALVDALVACEVEPWTRADARAWWDAHPDAIEAGDREPSRRMLTKA